MTTTYRHSQMNLLITEATSLLALGRRRMPRHLDALAQLPVPQPRGTRI